MIGGTSWIGSSYEVVYLSAVLLVLQLEVVLPFMNINELTQNLSQLPVNIPGFSQLSNGKVRVC